MKEIDTIQEKLVDKGFGRFTNYLIDGIKSKHGIYQYNIASKIGVKPIDISLTKNYSRYRSEPKFDDILLKIIKSYNVNVDILIEEINQRIEDEKKEEARKIEEGKFQLNAYLYDEIHDKIFLFPLKVNTYQSTAFLKDINNNEIYSGRFWGRNLTFNNKRREQIQFMLNSKSTRQSIKKKHIISGISTEILTENDGYGVKSVLITSSDIDKKIEDDIKYYFYQKKIQASFNFSSTSSFKKLIEDHKKHNKEVKIKIPKELITGYKQFLDYFADYVKFAKGEEIRFDISKLNEGLEISIGVSNDSSIENVGEYLNEYLGFAKQNIDSLKINVETDISETDFNLLVLDLKHQVTSLKHSLELSQLRNNLLSGQVEHLKELSTNFSQKEVVINTQLISGGDQQFADRIKNEK